MPIEHCSIFVGDNWVVKPVFPKLDSFETMFEKMLGSLKEADGKQE